MAKRKLTTIFCADVEGYSGLVAADEEGTLKRLRQCRAMMAEGFARFDGREINSWGDAVIAEFGSVVEAVRCAVDVQAAMETTNIDADRPLRFRIGINLGDVVEDGGNVYGEGVNVAARLESIAPAGGVLVSDTVHALSHKRLALGFDRVEPVQVKPDEEAVGGYAVRIQRRNEPAGLAAVEPSPLRNPTLKEGPRVLTRTAYASDRLDRWLTGQSRSVRVAGGFILFFFLINLLFSGLTTPWFIFPAAPFFLYILWSLRSGVPDEGETRAPAGVTDEAKSIDDES